MRKHVKNITDGVINPFPPLKSKLLTIPVILREKYFPIDNKDLTIQDQLKIAILILMAFWKAKIKFAYSFNTCLNGLADSLR